MGTCLFCHEVTSGEDFCGVDCYEAYNAAKAEVQAADEGYCGECREFIRPNGECGCEPEDEEAFERGERMDYNEDFGYDPYAGGPELDEPCDWYDHGQEYEY